VLGKADVVGCTVGTIAHRSACTKKSVTSKAA
jgi:hypothetical protein